MDVIVLQVFVSLMLVVGSIALFLFSWKQRDFEESDRLALLPIEKEETEDAHE
jgi:hypothetical protein